MHAEDEQSITLKNENDNLKVIPRKEIDEITVQEKSLMPEGLNKNMTVQDFRDLIRYLMANPFLIDVQVAGPFAAAEQVSINPGDPQQSKGVKWMQPAVGPAGKIPLPASKGSSEAVAYIAAEVTAASAMQSRLQVGASHALEVWLNGKRIYEGRPGDGRAAPDQAAVDVALREGPNRLLFRVIYRGDKQILFARLLDPQRKVR